MTVALLAAAQTALGGTTARPAAYLVGDVPATPTVPYFVVSIGLGTPAHYTMDAKPGASVLLLAVQLVGRTVNEVLAAAAKADTAFLGKHLNSSVTACREERSADPQRDPDGGAYMYGVRVYSLARALP